MKLIKNTIYKHEDRFHNMSSANVIAPLVMKLFNPSSVIDVGCGTGTFLKAFKEMGVEKICGLDGSWVNKKMLLKNISKDEFNEVNLENLQLSKKKYDIVICLEVAEHLRPECAASFINSLVTYGDIIIFSAAIPDQGGQNHLNEQWPSYWQIFFENKGFQMYDCLRSRLWEENSVDFYYKQNIFLYIKKSIVGEIKEEIKMPPRMMERIIHPDVFQYKSQFLERILEGRFTFKGYCKMFLKFMLNFFRIR